MLHTDLHRRIPEITARLVAAPADPEIGDLEDHASGGCSVCARALVNARDRVVDLALAAPAGAPSSALRERLLAAARLRRGHGIEVPGRALDPASVVAHLHIGAAGDAERTRFVAEYDALGQSADDPLHRLLAEVSRLIAFPLLFVSIVHGERVAYRVERGLPEGLSSFRDMRREMTFCTHCVAAESPLVVPDAATEPFFRSSKMVQRFGIGAYAGVPLRASNGVVFGTLCGLDFAPHPIGPDLVRLMQLYAEPTVAEIEGDERARLEMLRGVAVHRFAWFERLLDIEVARAQVAAPCALLTLTGPQASCLAEVAQSGEPLGRVDQNALGLMIPGAGLAVAAARAGAIRARFPGVEVRFAAVDARRDSVFTTGADFRTRALGR